MNEINIKSNNLCTKNTPPLLLEEVIPVQGYIDKRSWGIYPSTFCHPLLTIKVVKAADREGLPGKRKV